MSRTIEQLLELKRRIEWAVMIGALTGVLALGSVGCTEGALTGPSGSVVPDDPGIEQPSGLQDAGAAAAERQREKNDRINGGAEF